MMLRLLIIIAALATAGCETEPRTVRLGGLALGTSWSAQLSDRSADVSTDILQQELESAIARVDQVMSTYRDDSNIVRFNRATATDWIAVPDSLAEVVAAAAEVSELSSGAFDITVNPVVELWGFGAAGPRDERPSASELDAVRNRIGYEHIAARTSPPALRKAKPALSIDLSAIAKGYAVDQLADTVERLGSSNYLVEIGGELRGRGVNADGVPWRIAVERPDAGRRDVQQLLELRDKSLATSGDYRNYFEQDGQRYSHTIDPRTAAPVTHKLASVTVLADTAMRADALATALLVLGPIAGPELAERESIAAMFITRNDDEFVVAPSPAMQCYLEASCP